MSELDWDAPLVLTRTLLVQPLGFDAQRFGGDLRLHRLESDIVQRAVGFQPIPEIVGENSTDRDLLGITEHIPGDE